jgi:type IV pilus assembly protein PilB
MSADLFNGDDEALLAEERAIHFVDEEMCRFYKILPIKFDVSNRVLTVCMPDPTNLGTLDDLRYLLAIDEVLGVAADPKKIEAATSRYYSGKQESIEDIINSIQAGEDMTDGRGSH